MKKYNKKKTGSKAKSKNCSVKYKSIENFYQEHSFSKTYAESNSALSDESIGFNPFLNFSITSSSPKKIK